ncbi:MAG: YdcF family protein [Spirochaetes bacterium]|nr:YdcF family protein [Spirochaetota bacterium]
MKKKLFKIFLFSILLFCVIVLGNFFWHFQQCLSYIELEKFNNSSSYEAAIVFYSDFNQQGTMDIETLRRLNFAIQLYQNKSIHNLIFVGGARPNQEKYGSFCMYEYAAEQKVNKEHIYYETVSQDTIFNFLEGKKIAEQNNWDNIVIISSYFQLKRIESILKEEIPSTYISLHYPENKANPSKSLLNSYYDYFYNGLSKILYILVPKNFYRTLVKKIRH